MTETLFHPNPLQGYPFPLLRQSSLGVGDDADTLHLTAQRAWLRDRQSQSVEDPRRKAAWQRLGEAIEQSAAPGWNAGEGEPINPRTRNEAQRFLLTIPEGLWPTDIYPEADGDLAFEWYASRERLVIVSFDGKQRAIYVIRMPGEREAGQIQFSGSLPSVIRFHLLRFFQLGALP